MAKVDSVNNLPATGGVAMYTLMVFLRDQMGFTITISGDGLSAFDNTGTSVITSGASGANGMNNTDAHFTAADPSGVYEWCFQRNASSIDWEVVVSALDGFTGGSSTSRPTATDEQQMHNTTLLPTDNTYRLHIVGNTTAISGVFPWWFGSYITGTGQPSTFIAHEPLQVNSYPPLVGTRAVPTTGEPDPCVYICGGPVIASFTLNVTGWQADVDPPNPVRHWYAMNNSNGQTEAFNIIKSLSFTGTSTFADTLFPATSGSEGVGISALTSEDPAMPIGFGREIREINPIFKGFSATLLMKGVFRIYPDTVDIAGERYVYMGDLLLPWPNSVTPLT